MQGASRLADVVRAAEDELFALANFRTTTAAASGGAQPHQQAHRGASLQVLPTSEDAEAAAILWGLLSKRADERGVRVRITPGRPAADIVNEGVRLGVFGSQSSDHPVCTRECRWESFVTNHGYQQPGLGQRFRATGDVYVCTYSGRVHVCNEMDCVPYLQNVHGTYICTVSARTRGSAVALAEARADKATIRNADALTTSLSSLAPPQPPKLFGRFRRPSVAVPPPPLPPPPPADAVAAGAKRRATEPPQQQRQLPAHLQPFAPGSAAERYLQHLTSTCPGRDGPGERGRARVRYGADLIHFHLSNISWQSRNNAAAWCKTLLASPSAQRLHADNMAEVERQFEESVARVRHVAETSPGHYAALVFQLCMQAYSPHVDRVVWTTLARRSAADDLVAYFSTALLYVWKIVECTPKCCANPHAAASQLGAQGAEPSILLHQPADDAPTSKRRRASFHLDKCALAIIYMLSEGHAINVFHDAVSGQIISETDAERLVGDVLPDGRPRVGRERIEFVPPHRFLQTMLPAQSHVRRVDFSAVLVKGKASARTPQAQAACASAANFNPSMVTITGQLQEAFRSLCNCRPALTLEQVKQYRLAYHLTIRDFFKTGEASIVSRAERPPEAPRASTES